MKLTIELDMNIEDAKAAYRRYYGYPDTKKVTKADLSSLAANFATADMLDVFSEIDDPDMI